MTLSFKSKHTFSSIALRKIGSIANRSYGLQRIESSGRKLDLTMQTAFANSSTSATMCKIGFGRKALHFSIPGERVVLRGSVSFVHYLIALAQRRTTDGERRG